MPTRDLWCQNHETRRSDEINVSNGLRLQSPHQGPTEAAFSAACECIAALSAEVSRGRRKLLVEMATGTGKTRTAAAFIKRLLEAGVVTRVLFLVDRIALARQARISNRVLFWTSRSGDTVISALVVEIHPVSQRQKTEPEICRLFDEFGQHIMRRVDHGPYHL